MEILLQKGDHSSSQVLEHSSPHSTCKILASQQSEFSELVLDVAWLLKKPASEQKLTSSHIQRLNSLLEYLVEKESTFILNGLYSSLRSAIDNNLVVGDSDSDVRLLHTNMDTARRRLAPKSHEKVPSELAASSGNCDSHSSENDNATFVPTTNQVRQVSRRTLYFAMNARNYDRISFLMITLQYAISESSPHMKVTMIIRVLVHMFDNKICNE